MIISNLMQRLRTPCEGGSVQYIAERHRHSNKSNIRHFCRYLPSFNDRKLLCRMDLRCVLVYVVGRKPCAAELTGDGFRGAHLMQS